MGMNPEVKAQWLSALRSGEWPQGRDELNDGEGRYCCLGVLCEMAKDQGVTDMWEVDGQTDMRIYGNREAYEASPWEYDGSWSSVPVNVQQWAGLDDHDPYVTVPLTHPEFAKLRQWNAISRNGRARVSTLNDNGFTFEEIADLIDAQL